jgi:hypothetical protein
MEAIQPTYMLLPNFRFHPDGELQLGAVIGHNSKTNIPDQRHVLNEGHITNAISPQYDTIMGWKGTVNDKTYTKASLWADIASMVGLGVGGQSGGGSDSGLNIACDRTVWTSSHSFLIELINAAPSATSELRNIQSGLSETLYTW